MLGVSPVFRDLASRSEENLIGDLLFLATVTLLLAYTARDEVRSPWLVALGAAAMLTALNHFQFFLVLAGGATLACLVGWTYDYLRYASKWLLGIHSHGPGPPGGGLRALIGLLAIAIALLVVLRSRDVLVVCWRSRPWACRSSTSP